MLPTTRVQTNCGNNLNRFVFDNEDVIVQRAKLHSDMCTLGSAAVDTSSLNAQNRLECYLANDRHNRVYETACWHCVASGRIAIGCCGKESQRGRTQALRVHTYVIVVRV